METTLICWVHGDPRSFAIDIDRNKTIAHLQNAIVTYNPNLFNNFDSKDLQICVANIPDTKKARNEFVFEVDDNISGSDTVQDIITDHFQGSLPGRKIHLAVKRPGK